MAFLDQDYLLTTDAAKEIYAAIKDLPILDPHNHCDVKALAEDTCFQDIWQAEAATDHYVWELMRKCGVDEALITGKEATNREKWNALAKVFPLFAGNPTYEWIHLDLKRRLGIDLEINAENADAIWEAAQQKLQDPQRSQQSLILEMNIETLCSTDDPADSLEYHKQLQNSRLAGRIRPTFRPDAAMNIDKPTWNAYVDRLGARWDMAITNIDEFLAALQKGHDAMDALGCRASDHGVEVPYGYQLDKETAAELFNKARNNQPLELNEIAAFKAWFLSEMGEMDAKSGWVFQIHYGCRRDIRKTIWDGLGPDAGGDIGDDSILFVKPLLPFLNRFDGRLKVVLYNMTPSHNAALAMLTRAFGNTVSLGSAWWLNDSFQGMKTQLELASSIDLFSNMAGMVSDSRKILSYGSRFELFRRTLSLVLGDMTTRGQMSIEVAKMLAKNLSYDRPKQLFGF